MSDFHWTLRKKKKKASNKKQRGDKYFVECYKIESQWEFAYLIGGLLNKCYIFGKKSK